MTCRYCIGPCSHTGDNDRLEWRETDGWVTDAESAKSWSTPSASRGTTQNTSQDRPRTTRPPTPFAGLSAPILRRDGGEVAER